MKKKGIPQAHVISFATPPAPILEAHLEAIRLLASGEPLPREFAREPARLRRLLLTVDGVRDRLRPHLKGIGRPRRSPAPDFVRDLHHLVADYLDVEVRFTSEQRVRVEKLAPGLLLSIKSQRGTRRPESTADEILAVLLRVSPASIRRIRRSKKGGTL